MEGALSNGVKSMDMKESGDSFVDLTDEFFKSASNIKIGDVVKSRYFALFEGTRALEAMNDVLDTGLIAISKEKLTFDPTEPRNIDVVIRIATELFGSLMTWLNTSSLPVTVLSCRYVEECLKNFDGTDLRSCNFGVDRADFESNIEFLLVHKVLLSIVRGFLVFIKNVITLGQAGVLYEEEDINTTTMGFDHVFKIPNDAVEEDISESTIWLEAQVSDPHKQHLISFLKIAGSLCQFNNLLSYNVNVYNEIIPKQAPFLHVCLKELIAIKLNQGFYKTLPALPIGCFSEGIQKRNDNFFPPRARHQDPLDKSTDAAIDMVRDLITMMRITTCKNVTELTDFLNAFMNKRDPPSHVIARAMLQLFFVRDDRSIMGSTTERFMNLVVEDMASLTCYDHRLLEERYHDMPPELGQAFSELLHGIESAFYSFTLSVSQNPCRQRQHFNRAILVWDALQVQTENFEIALAEKCGINETFKAEENGEDIPAMPISSWVYYQKLRAMLEVVLRGVELEIYKHWELYSIFWYMQYLAASTIEHLKRIILALEYKKISIMNMNKKIKKLKAGEKKQQMKDSYREKLEKVVPQLDSCIASLRSKIFEIGIMKALADEYIMLFTMLHDLGLLKSPKLNKISEYLSYGLKMKSFQSVGVPEFPGFDKWLAIRAQALAHVTTDSQKLSCLERIRSGCDRIKGDLQEYSKVTFAAASDNFALQERKKSYEQLVKSCVGLSVTSVLLTKQIRDNSSFAQDCNTGRYEVTIEREGYYRSFPSIKVTKKSPR